MSIGATTKWYAGAGIASVLVLAGGWFVAIAPQQASASDIDTQTTAVASQNLTTVSQIAALKAQFKNLPLLEGQLATIRAHIPQTPEEPTLLRTLSTLAKSSGVKLVAIQAQTPAVVGGTGSVSASGASPLAAAGQVSQIGLSIQIKGPFANTRLFLTGLESMQRAMLVTGLDIGRDSTATDSKSVLTTVVTCKVFMANPGAATAPTTNTATTTSSSTTVQPS